MYMCVGISVDYDFLSFFLQYPMQLSFAFMQSMDVTEIMDTQLLMFVRLPISFSSS